MHTKVNKPLGVTTMNNVSNKFLAAVLLCGFVTSANAEHPGKEADASWPTAVVVNSQSRIVPWGMTSPVASKRATRDSTQKSASLFRATRKDTLRFSAFENSGADRLSLYQPYFRDGETVTNPHKLHRWRLVRW